MVNDGAWIIETNKNVKNLPQKLAEHLEFLGEKIIDDANQTVPYDTGDLMRSGQAVQQANKMEVILFYDRPYFRVHEEAEDGTFNYQSPEARSGWLQKTINEKQQKYSEWLAKKAQTNINDVGFRKQ
jgi:hypothetical protein